MADPQAQASGFDPSKPFTTVHPSGFDPSKPFTDAASSQDQQKPSGPPTGFMDMMTRMGSQLASDFNPLNMIHGLVTAPYQLAKLQFVDQPEKVAQAKAHGENVKAWFHEAARYAPVVGPIVDNLITRIANGESPEVAADLITMMTVPAAGKALGKVGEYVLPKEVAAATPTAESTAMQIQPQSGPKLQKIAVLAQKVAPELVKKGLASAKFEETAGNVKQFLTDASDAWKEAEQQALKKPTGVQMVEGKPVRVSSLPTADLLASLEKERARLNASRDARAPVPEGNQAQAAVLDRAIMDLKAVGPRASLDQIVTLRDSLDKIANASGAYNRAPTDPSPLAGQAASRASGIYRDTIAQWYPEMKEANANYSLAVNADKVIEASKLAKFVKDSKGIGPATTNTEAIARIVNGVMAAAGSTTAKVKALSDLHTALTAGKSGGVLPALWRAAGVAGVTGAELNALLQQSQMAPEASHDQPFNGIRIVK